MHCDKLIYALKSNTTQYNMMQHDTKSVSLFQIVKPEAGPSEAVIAKSRVPQKQTFYFTYEFKNILWFLLATLHSIALHRFELLCITLHINSCPAI